MVGLNEPASGSGTASQPAVVEHIGIYGGTFDPPHYAHLYLAEFACDALALSKVLFVPAGTPPHKSTRSDVQHRLKMLELAIRDNPTFHISRVDLDRPAPHYSVDMVTLLRQQYPDAHFEFLIGGDSFRDLPSWRTPDEIVADRTRFVVMPRPGVDTPMRPDLHDKRFPGLSEKVMFLPTRLLHIASTDIVAELRAGRSVRYLLPDAVLDYIEQHHLYT
jgi:nicotinate-nucleotide adenylyltransferase